MVVAETAEAAHDIHASGKCLSLSLQAASSTGWPGQTLTEGRVEPFDVDGEIYTIQSVVYYAIVINGFTDAVDVGTTTFTLLSLIIVHAIQTRKQFYNLSIRATPS